MWESGEPMEFGIFDFYKVFQGLLMRGLMEQWGLRMEGGGCRPDHSSAGINSKASPLFYFLFLKRYITANNPAIANIALNPGVFCSGTVGFGSCGSFIPSLSLSTE